MSQIPKVKIIRAPEREGKIIQKNLRVKISSICLIKGLIKARIRGTLAAKAPTLTFLDSHVECCEGWLEPLLDRIARNSSTVVCPVIDVINDNTFAITYQTSNNLQVGGFEWEMVKISINRMSKSFFRLLLG